MTRNATFISSTFSRDPGILNANLLTTISSFACPVPTTEPGFGASQKGDGDINDDNFVSPLNASCERRSRFGFRGGVRPEKPETRRSRTIDLLASMIASLLMPDRKL